MKQQSGYEQKLRNTGAQDVPAQRGSERQQKATATRGRDLRAGK